MDGERASAGVTAEASCEHYGLGDGANGQDEPTLISYNTYRAYNENPAYRDCGGGWSIYMRQNLPGSDGALRAGAESLVEPESALPSDARLSPQRTAGVRSEGSVSGQ